MFNDIEAIKRIRRNLFNISSNLHAESYIMSHKKNKKGYTPTHEASEAQEIYKLSLQSEEWDRKTEEKIKAFIMLKRMYNDNLLMNNDTYWK